MRGIILLLNKLKIKIKSLIKEYIYKNGYILVDKEGFFYNQSISLIFAKHNYFNKKLSKIEKLFGKWIEAIANMKKEKNEISKNWHYLIVILDFLDLVVSLVPTSRRN